MPAKDYQICCAMFNAYIAKVSKRNPNLMLDDRREITENEILDLIDWYLNKREEPKDGHGFEFTSHFHRDMKIEVWCRQRLIGWKPKTIGLWIVH